MKKKEEMHIRMELTTMLSDDINMYIVINYPELLADPVVVQVGEEEWSCN